MPDNLESRDIDALLAGLPLRRAPDDVWNKVQAALSTPEAPTARPAPRRVRPWLAAAAMLAALLGGSYLGALRSYRAPGTWTVQALAGAPMVADAQLATAGMLTAGQWLVTDSVSRAELTVGRIGVAQVGPNSRVRLERGALTEHRLTMERGSLHAVIEAPPRLFFVQTPAALATDLGCEYVLDVDEDGASRIHVLGGWVELERGGHASLVPAGMVAEVEVGKRPGTPYPVKLPADARAALHRVDDGSADETDLDLVLGALSGPADFVTLRRESAITLWHLLQRVDLDRRERVLDRLVELAPPPSGVTMEGILGLNRPMLERWRRDLNPMWSEEAQPWLTRVARRLWTWTIG